ncbi:Growth factor receptor-bound protein 2 [Labeo rohita]|uniref:Growth factor receptor-bound protein 2 n=1 Tax=Labeo rohita TaxID=84645 RepID=A0ABQ8MLQ3_LABRO|nr:Growth factor receptor-bound protein 2 [Labeo rohita]
MEATGKYDFTATAEDELSFRKGDTIKILGTNDDWFRAEINGMEGFVPRNYINIHFPRIHLISHTRSLLNRHPSLRYSRCHSRDVSQSSDELQSQIMLFFCRRDTITEHQLQPILAHPNPHHYRHRRRLRCRFGPCMTSLRSADELNFHTGDIIEVLDQSDRFWWKGVLRGRTGLFPVNYTNPV